MKIKYLVLSVVFLLVLSGCKTTELVVEFRNVESTATSISFELKSISENVIFSHSELFIENTNIQTIDDFDNLVFTDLEPVTEYIVIVYFGDSINNNQSSNISTRVKTKEYNPITVSVSCTSTQIGYATNIDPNSDVIIKDIRLTLNNDVIEQTLQTVGRFYNLLSGKEYKIEIDYDYRLKSNQEYSDKTAYKLVKTIEKVIPKMTFEKVMVGKNEIIVNVSIRDLDLTGKMVGIKLFKDGVLVQQINSTTRARFLNLEGNSRYEIQAIYEYNINDGTGIQYINIFHDVVTIEDDNDISFTNTVVTSSSISFNISCDTAIYKVIASELYKDGILISSKRDNLEFFDGLNPNTEYIVRIILEYQIEDSANAIFIEKTIKTQLIIPHVDINTTVIGNDFVSFDVNIVDPSKIISIGRISLYMNNELISNIDDVDYVFRNLFSKTKYEIRVEYSYDLLDEKGIVNEQKSEYFETHEKKMPIIEYKSVEVINEKIVFEIIVLDYDDTLIEVEICLIVNEINMIDIEYINGITTYECEDISDSSKVIKIQYTYNLNENDEDIKVEIFYKLT